MKSIETGISPAKHDSFPDALLITRCFITIVILGSPPGLF